MGGGHEPHLESEAASTRSGSRIPKLKAVGKGPGFEYNNKMSLQLYMDNIRNRADMTPAEREWRKKWLLSQRLHPDEPIAIEAVYRNLNPVRRLYRYPWDMLYQKVLEPKFGVYKGSLIRAVTPKIIIGYIGVSTVYYWFKYNYVDWESYIGPSVETRREQLQHFEQINAHDPRLLRDYYAWFEADPKRHTDKGARFENRFAEKNIGQSQRPW